MYVHLLQVLSPAFTVPNAKGQLQLKVYPMGLASDRSSLHVTVEVLGPEGTFEGSLGVGVYLAAPLPLLFRCV